MLAFSGLLIQIAGKTILTDVSASFERGTATLLVGANGAGKTTLLRALAGRLGVSAGYIEAAGEAVDVESRSWKSRRVFLEADAGGLEDFSPTEQLRLRATLLGLDPVEGERRSRALEEEFGFGPHIGSRASTLSTGFKRRLALAIAFMSDACLMLLDEPLNGLDVEGAAAFIRLLRAFTAAGGTAVVASHITGPLLPAVGTVVEIADGHLVRHETAQAFFHRYAAEQKMEDTIRTFPWLAGRR